MCVWALFLPRCKCASNANECSSWSFFNITCVMIKHFSILPIQTRRKTKWISPMHRHFRCIHFNYALGCWTCNPANVIILFVIITNLFVNKIIVKKRLKTNWATKAARTTHRWLCVLVLMFVVVMHARHIVIETILIDPVFLFILFLDFFLFNT